MLSRDEVVGIVRRHLESKFPKTCLVCGRQYMSLADYLLRTKHLGHPVSGDNPLSRIDPARLIGTISYATCPCGSTLAINSVGIDLPTMLKLLQWAAVHMVRDGMTVGELLNELRGWIDDEVLREHFARESAAETSELHPDHACAIGDT